ncbi:MAG: hypothetical protein U1E27_08920, partial [Kiritimatiellia bacterium]|nr:hypothetical protein [Kiritimatiellia bacterium]
MAPASDPGEWTCRRIRAESLLDLRFRVLLAGTDRSDAHFDGDEDPDTRHYGLFIGDGILC